MPSSATSPQLRKEALLQVLATEDSLSRMTTEVAELVLKLGVGETVMDQSDENSIGAHCFFSKPPPVRVHKRCEALKSYLMTPSTANLL
jgi:hypothetical protein